MIIYGHRGNEKEYVENTMEAIINCPYDGIEIDVRFTRDRVIVLHHDELYKRIYNFDYKVDATNYNIALFFCPTLTTLYKVLEYVNNNKKKLIIDIKNEYNYSEYLRDAKEIIKYTIDVCKNIGYDIDNIIFLSWIDIIKPYDNINFFRVYDGDYLSINTINHAKDILQADGICLEYTGTEQNIETINMIKNYNLLTSVYTNKNLEIFLDENVKVDYLTI